MVLLCDVPERDCAALSSGGDDSDPELDGLPSCAVAVRVKSELRERTSTNDMTIARMLWIEEKRLRRYTGLLLNQMPLTSKWPVVIVLHRLLDAAAGRATF